MTNLLLILLLLVGCDNTPVEIDNDEHTHDNDNHTHYYCKYQINQEEIGEYLMTEYGCFNVNTYSECMELDNIYGLSEFYVESGTCEYFCDIITFQNPYNNCECIDDECIDLLQD